MDFNKLIRTRLQPDVVEQFLRTGREVGERRIHDLAQFGQVTRETVHMQMLLAHLPPEFLDRIAP